jgi:hypothetical protein
VGAGGRLQPRDGDRLVRLGVRAQPHAVLARAVGHALHVSFEDREVHQDGRRREVVEGAHDT